VDVGGLEVSRSRFCYISVTDVCDFWLLFHMDYGGWDVDGWYPAVVHGKASKFGFALARIKWDFNQEHA